MASVCGMLAAAMERPHRFGKRVALALAVIATAILSTSLAFADPPANPRSVAGSGEGEASPQAKASAQVHFQKAQELYQQGSYREAIADLEAAVALDPKAKNLYFNLGVVDEKLGRIDEALEQFRKYATFDLETDERARVEKYIRRLEGAKAQLALQPAPTFVAAPGGVIVQPRVEEKIPNGRVDAATVTAATVSLAGFGVGTWLALRASSMKPQPGYVTGRDGTYAELETNAKDAHKVAIFADVGFGVGIVAAVTTAYLYFARPRTRASITSHPPRAAHAELSGAPLPGGGQITLGGEF